MKLRFPLLAIAGIIFLFSACADDASPDRTGYVIIEGIEYRTTTIGTQTWTNVNHAGPGGVSHDHGSMTSAFGKYYTQTEAETIPLPAGWRLPTREDYKKLAEFHGVRFTSNGTDTEGIKSLISESNWVHVSGTNASGFNAQPAGYMFEDAAPVPGEIAEFWTSEGYTLSIQEVGAGLTSLRMIFYRSNTSPGYRFNVRFVKD